MAQFKPIKCLSTKLDSLSKVEGQLIFTIDTKKIYLDVDNLTRIEYIQNGASSITPESTFDSSKYPYVKVSYINKNTETVPFSSLNFQNTLFGSQIEKIDFLTYFNNTWPIDFIGGSSGMWYTSNLKTVSNLDLSEIQQTRVGFSSSGIYQFSDILDLSNVVNAVGMFGYCYNLQECIITNLNNCLNMSGMFQNCSSLTKVHLGNFSKVQDMSDTFKNCYILKDFDFLQYPTSKYNMNIVFNSLKKGNNCFYNCRQLVEFPHGLPNIENMYQMFYGCSNLKTITPYEDIKIDFSKVSNLSGVFGYTDLSEIHFNVTLNINNAQTTFGMFRNSNITNTPNFIVSNKLSNMSQMFYYCNNLINISFNSFNNASPTDTSSMFTSDKKIQTLGSSHNMDWSNIIDCSSMFFFCSNLTNIDSYRSSTQTNNAINMSQMFMYCGQLTKVPNIVNTDKAENVYAIFYGTNLTSFPNLHFYNATNVHNVIHASVNFATKWNDSDVYNYLNAMPLANQIIQSSYDTLPLNLAYLGIDYDGAKNRILQNSTLISLLENKGWIVN